MAFQPVPDTARFSIVHDNYVSNVAINVLYFRNTTQWGLPDLITACNTLKDAWVAQVIPLMVSSARLARIEARGERAQTDVAYQLALSPGVQGGFNSEMLPLQCSLCITHLSGFTGRSARGRTYFPFLAEDAQNGGIMFDSRVAQYVGALQYVRDQMAAIGWQHVIVSRYSNKQKRTIAETLDVIGYRARDNEIDTQRRRTRANAP